MKAIVLLIILSVSAAFSQDKPKWINEPDKVCKSSEICVIGEGAGFQTASANARNEMAKVFKTKVVSTFRVTTSTDNKSFNENVLDDIQETTDQVLEGVEVVKRHETTDTIYVFASLDKNKASKRIRNAINDIDEKMEVYYEDKKRSSVFKLKRLFNQRETHNLRYEFLKGNRVPEKISFKQIVEKQKAMSQGVLVSVDIKERRPRFVQPLLVKSLGEVGFRVVPSGGTHSISGEYVSEKQHLKVDGFEKYKFVLNLYANNKDGHKTGALTFDVQTTGRDFSQAYNKALDLVKNHITENIDELNIQ